MVWRWVRDFSIGVGKTSIVLQLVDNYFSRSFKPTSGVFRINYTMLKRYGSVMRSTLDDSEITLSINDFPGGYCPCILHS